MKVRLFPTFSCGLLIAAVLAGQPTSALAQQSAEEIIETARSLLRADRQAVVTDVMQFTPDEAEAFWPIYHQ